MKKIIVILFLLSTKLTFGQINNGSFELWDTTFAVCDNDSDLINLFAVPNPTGGVINSWLEYQQLNCGIARTTDSYSGNYSLLLYNWYNYLNGRIIYHDSLSYRPQYLQGYFKYTTGGITGLEHGTAIVALTRYNGASIDTIATGTYQFDSTTSFSPFQVTLNYISALNPDSIYITFISANNYCQGGTSDWLCNLLYLDNLTLSSSPLGIENVNSNENLISVFPNPSSNELTVQNNSAQHFQFTLYNSLGQKLIDKTLTNKTNTINLSTYSNDIYFYKVSNYKQEIKSGKIIKQ